MTAVIDFKTGKATPAAALQTAAYSLLNDFNVTFDAERHVYTWQGKDLKSVTQILQEENFVDSTWFTEWARDKGSHVHTAIKYDLAGELDEDSLDDEIRPYLSAFRKFMTESGFKVERSETPGVNTTHHYAGTPDIIGCFPKPTVCRRYALELSADGKYKLVPFQDQNDFNVWLAAVAVHHWKNNNLKRR